MPSPPSEEETKLFDAANADLQQAADLTKKGDAAKGKEVRNGAIDKFRTFVSTYPNSSKGAEAYYGLGRSYFENSDFENARQAFDRIVTAYPASNIIPQSLHARALCEKNLQQFAQARATAEQLKTNFPAYNPQGVEKFLKEDLPPATAAPSTTTP